MVNKYMTKKDRTYNGRQSIQKMVLGSWTDICKQSETRPPSYTIYKNKLKID